ncbi:MDR family MFS transporter [Terribacillus saccharophilus]|uniref:MDR family MFS transporter n=1 Tax=Terribacillus saccharophilus TaxID=361277 RepID=UPI000BA5FE1C|nr:MDR family MFS transporter [Terribacillus saccharophilus]PAF18626.1 hypothetical protein CHH51_06930 [Terribacillus saccharophilus]
MKKRTTNKTLVTIGVMLGLLFASLDQTIVSTALPTITSDLGGLAFYSWVIAVYMLTESIGIPIFGKLSDIFDRKKIYMIGLGFFLVGSILCGLAHDIILLVIARGIQGIGAGALLPLAFTMIADIYSVEQRAKIQGVLGSMFMISSILGPAIGGFLTENLSWHWIFFINIPIALIAAAFIWVGYQESSETQQPSIDWWGAITLTLGILATLLTTVLTGGEGGHSASHTWGSPLVLTLLIGGLVLLALFVWIETKAKDPILPMYLFKNRVTSILSVVSFFMGLGMFGAISFLPLYLQNVKQMSATASGYMLLPLMLGAMIAGIFGGFVLTRFKYRNLLVISLLGMVGGFLMLSALTSGTSLLYFGCCAGIIGLGMGVLMPALTTLTQELVPKKDIGAATASINLFRSLGATIGISLLGGVLNSQVADDAQSSIRQNPDLAGVLSQNIQDALRNPEGISQNAYNALQTIFIDGLHTLFLLSAGLIAVAVIFALFIGNGKLSSSKPLEENTTSQH